MLKWLLLFSVLLVAACGSSGGGGSFREIPDYSRDAQINLASTCNEQYWASKYNEAQADAVSCTSKLATSRQTEAILWNKIKSYQTEVNEAAAIKSSIELAISQPHNPTGTTNYDYFACGEKYTGSKTGCAFTVYCTGSMKPLFDCTEKLFFTTRKASIEIGDVVDIKLPVTEAVRAEGKMLFLSRKIHMVVDKEGDRYITARINPGTEGFHSTVRLVDEFKPTQTDINGVLKGVEW